MKIVELITFLAGGGAERFVVDLSNQLAKDHDISLVTILDDEKDPEIRNFYRSEISDSVHYVNLGIPNGLKLSSQWKVFIELRKLNPDVIHVHLPASLNYSALAICLLSFSRKVYFSVHSDLRNGHDRGLLKFYCNSLGRIGRFKLACLSEKNYKDFTAFYKHTTIRCITNGRAPILKTERFSSVQYELNSLKQNEGSILLMHIARFHPVKNQSLLVEATNSLVEMGHNIDLVIIGIDYDSESGKKLQSIACNRIHFIGSRMNISDYILNADLFCLSSDFEGMPITLLEANLAGVPAVSTPVCGAVDLIKNGVNGVLSASHQLEDYKLALREALMNLELLKNNAIKMKDNSPYTIAECARRYYDYFLN